MVRRYIAIYAATMIAGFLLVSLAFFFVNERLRPPTVYRDRLPLKTRYYYDHAEDYDVLFFGDSRTYCGFHPEFLDEGLGLRSFNLAVFAHWLPTQLPFAEDVIPRIPPGTRVVWGVGHQNFFPASEAAPTVSHRYPIGNRNALWYYRLGLDPIEILRNLATYHPLTSFWMEAPAVFHEIQMQRDRVVFRAGAAALPEPVIADSVAELERRFLGRPGVGRVQTIREGDLITSVALYHHGGGYMRVELVPDYFRAKQREILEAAGGPIGDAEADSWGPPEPDPRLVPIFERVLDLFEAAGIELLVVEMEEAPFFYRNPRIRVKWRGFMDRVVRPRVESRGFSYLRLDLSSIHSEDYFDFNHLNEHGVKKFSEVLIPQLAPEL